MKARILFMVVVFLLPSPNMAQNLDCLSNHFSNNFQKNNLCIRNNFSTDDERSLYLIRITGVDREDKINFYGISIGFTHSNPKASFSGFCLNLGLGSLRRYETYISINGLNFSLFGLSTEGTINGFSLGTLFNSAIHTNGILIGATAGSDYLNGIVIAGLMSISQYSNAIQIAGILNIYCNFNGIGIALINSTMSGFEGTMKSYSIDYCTENKVYGIMLGLYNAVDVRGISLALVNNGDGWLQIGIVNIGDSILQIGLVNLHSNGKIGIPIINVNF
ncbi:MAG: hypothetical protein IPM14_04570 [bacterium]|nr:hypothetical protein [bacterium]